MIESRGDGERTTILLHRLLVAQQSVSSILAGSESTSSVLERVLQTVCRTMAWSFGAAWQPGEAGNSLRCTGTWNEAGTPAVGTFAMTSLSQSFERGRGIPGRVLEQRSPVWLRDLRRDPRMESVAGADRAGLRSAVAVPLESGERLEGVLEFFGDEVREPDGEVMTWLMTVGAQLAQHLAHRRHHDVLVDHDRALAAAVNGIVISDATLPGFPIVYANPGFERLTGYSMAEVCGGPCSILQGPETDPAVIAKVGAALATGSTVQVEMRNYRKDGTVFWNELHLSPVVNGVGELVQYIGVQNDVSDRRAAAQQAEFLAFHDPLTGLANRGLMHKVLDRAVARAQEPGGTALLFVDLDGFKALNDTYGHAACDHVLCEIADRLRAATRSNDLVVRQGGDEFLVLMPDLAGDAHAMAVPAAERVRSAIRAPLTIGDDAVTVDACVGVSLLGVDAEDADALLRHADAAMYRAKRTGQAVKLFSAPSDRPVRRGDPDAERQRREALDEILANDRIRPVYQSIVDLRTREVLGYEALARGPEGSMLERPDLMFAAARDAGRLGELDWACRVAAVRGAVQARLGREQKLFVNVEPATLGDPPPSGAVGWNDGDGDLDLDVVVEVTERALTSRPADLLRTIDEIRARGWAIALDDVGADVRSLALMPLVRPDVIKLDLRLVQQQPNNEIAEIVHAVNAERERTGAVLLAEGIENEAHLETALALGATVGQGWLFSRPAALPVEFASPTRPLQLRVSQRAAVTAPSPYEAVRRHRDVRRGDKRLLLSISKNLEQQAAALGECAVIVGAFQSADRFTPLTRRRYTRLATDAALVVALGVGMDPEPAPGVRGTALDPGDPLLGEWSVAVLGPHFAAALVAMDLGDSGPDMRRRFDFALTYDRDLVTEAVNSLTARIRPIDLLGVS